MPGRFFEDFNVGDVLRHSKTKTVTQADNIEFCRLTDNNQPLHLDEAYAKKTPFGRVVVNGLLPISWGVGVSVEDTTAGTLVGNLGYEDVQNTAPTFPGDTLRCETTVLEKRPSSKPDRGIVTLRHSVRKQDGTEVATFKRIVMVQIRGSRK
ncbi:MAG: MaoC family dehydratase [Euryarchaeota archaeon]|nr:MaoC family dehydratase [Euryarchaeota archaeon]